MSRRGNSEGSIYCRKDGRWVAAVTDPTSGRQLYWYGKTRAAAAAHLNQALRDRDAGIRLGDARQAMGKYLENWLVEVAKLTVRPSTYASYAGVVGHDLIPALGKIPLGKLGPEHVQMMMRHKLDAGLSPRRVQYIRAILRKALMDAMRWGLVVRNVASLARAPRQVTSEVSPLSPDEVKAFLAHVGEQDSAPLYTVAIALGLRQGELLGLRWCDVDFDAGGKGDGILRVSHALQRLDGREQLVQTKTERSRRTLFLPPSVVQALGRQRAIQREQRVRAGAMWLERGFVFTGPHGAPLKAGTVTRTFQRHLAEAGIPRHRFHDLRHTCATLLLGQGVNPRVVMDVLGHSHVWVTLDIYSHVLPEVHREAMDRMDSWLRGQPPLVPLLPLAPSSPSLTASPTFGPLPA